LPAPAPQNMRLTMVECQRDAFQTQKLNGNPGGIHVSINHKKFPTWPILNLLLAPPLHDPQMIFATWHSPAN
jgi:hypothetical protein